MKKMATRLVALVLCLSCVAPVALAAEGTDTTDTKESEATLVATLTDIETGSTRTMEVKPDIINVEENEGGDVCEASAEVFLPVEGIKTRTSVGKDKTDGGVTARIKVTYQISSNKEMIKIMEISGGWTPSSSIYLVGNREVGMHCGGFASLRIKKNPTSNSFSYSTGWGYVDFVTSGNGSPFAWADATITVSGMSGSAHHLSVEMYFPDNR